MYKLWKYYDYADHYALYGVYWEYDEVIEASLKAQEEEPGFIYDIEEC